MGGGGIFPSRGVGLSNMGGSQAQPTRNSKDNAKGSSTIFDALDIFLSKIRSLFGYHLLLKTENTVTK